jgi:CRP/FNR family transcriptional regulator
MAKEIQREQQMMFLLSRKTAEQRLATLLQNISQHLHQRRLRGDNFRLSMSRHDIGNYLGLAVETVCRIMTRFQKLELIQNEGRNVALLDARALDEMANSATAVARKTA